MMPQPLSSKPDRTPRPSIFIRRMVASLRSSKTTIPRVTLATSISCRHGPPRRCIRAHGGTVVIGRPLRRQEDPRLVRGKGTYVADLALPGMAHMAVLRSPHAHARIEARDFSEAARMPGVLAVLSAADVASLEKLPVLNIPPGQRQTSYPILPADKVLYVGQPVAAVVAETRYVAADALERMRVTYAPLPAVTDVDEAMSGDAPRLHEGWPDNLVSRREILTGDPDSMFAAAHTIVEGAFTMPRQAAAPLEGRAACASYDRERDELTVWVSSQAPHQWRTVMAATLGIEENRIVVIVPDVGG